MFTGIVETIGTIQSIEPNKNNLSFRISCPFTDELVIDQSIAHNGVCLTVDDIDNGEYRVTAIDETLAKTNLGTLKVGDNINLERSVKANDRMDGHIVQGHVDTTATCNKIAEVEGSWIFSFDYDPNDGNKLVGKGSICINGVSLTIVDVQESSFSVAIIPFTFEHTNFNELKEGDAVNLEYDIIGKYVEKIMKKR